MARQVLHIGPEPPEQLDRWRRAIDPRVAQVALERLLRINPLELIHDLRERVDLHRLESEHLADFTRGAAAAIRDDVCGHCYPWPFGGYPWPFGGYPWRFGG